MSCPLPGQYFLDALFLATGFLLSLALPFARTCRSWLRVICLGAVPSCGTILARAAGCSSVSARSVGIRAGRSRSSSRGLSTGAGVHILAGSATRRPCGSRLARLDDLDDRASAARRTQIGAVSALQYVHAAFIAFRLQVRQAMSRGCMHIRGVVKHSKGLV